MTTAPTTDFEALRAEVRGYVEDEGERWSELIEREHQVPLELWDELRDRGYLRLAAPVEYGGAGIPFTRYLELLELFSMSHASLRMIVHVANGIWRPMDSHANDDQRERFIKPAIAGDIKVAFTLTEPGAGSGADIRCSVVREGDTYYLSGEKHLITFGTIADYLLTFARVEGTRGTDGTVALMVPTRGEGVDAREMAETMGVRGTDHGHIVFDRAPVPVADRFGEEGQGVEIALSGFLGPSRISLATTCVGLAQRALDLALDYAQRRETFGKKIAERQAIAFKLAEMATDVEAGRRLVWHAAAKWEQTGHAPMEAAMAKLFASEMLQRVTDAALQVHGGIGYWSSSPIERVYRDARAQRFEEGTAEIQKTTIARDLLAPMTTSASDGLLLPDPRRGFEGKVALITGASRGIGRALALRLAARGAMPIINYKPNEEAAPDTVAEIKRLGADGLAIRADLESLEEIEAMFDQVQERFGRLDFFVSNASASNFHHFMDLKPHHLERTFNLNVRAFVVGTQRAVRLMPDGGRVVVLSSYGSIRAFPTYANLGSAKAALEAWARYMAVELAPLGVNVNAVNGGIIETDSSSYFYATGRVPSLDTVLPKIPKQRMGTRRRGRRVRAVPAVAGGGVHDRDDADRRRRADRGRAAVPRGHARAPPPGRSTRCPRRSASSAPRARARVAGGRDRPAGAAPPDRDGLDAPRARGSRRRRGGARRVLRERAAGGAALIVTGGSAVSRVGAGGRNYSFVNETSEAGKLARVAAAVHDAGGSCCFSCSTPGDTRTRRRSG